MYVVMMKSKTPIALSWIFDIDPLAQIGKDWIHFQKQKVHDRWLYMLI